MANKPTRAVKLDDPREIVISPILEGRRNVRAGQSVRYPNARAVEAVIKVIPSGESMMSKEPLAKFARQYGADITRPVTSGVCLRVVAEASYGRAFTVDDRAAKSF